MVLLASPFALFMLRRRPLALMLRASIVCYLLIVDFRSWRFPILYLTYFEMLYTPIRNVIFFIHLLDGRLRLPCRRTAEPLPTTDRGAARARRASE